MKTKTIKTPLMMAETFGLSCWPSSLAHESKLSRNLKPHPGLVPRLSHHRGKNSENREQKQTCLHSAEVHPVFAGTAETVKTAAQISVWETQNVFLVFSFRLLEAVGCFQFVQQRRQVNLDSIKHEGKQMGVTHQQQKGVFKVFC